MKKIILLAALAAISISALAIPARPIWKSVSQPDGSAVEVRLVGDEFGHAYVDRSGNILKRDADGYLRQASAAELSSVRREAIAKRARTNRARARSLAPAKVSGTPHVPVLLVEFKDQKFKDPNTMTIPYSSEPKTAFTNLLNQSGYSYNGATGSVKDFYVENSNGVYNPTFDVLDKVTLTKDESSYGGNDSNDEDTAPELAVYEAVKALDSTVDFSQYDQDGDGEIDMILMYYAGSNEAEGASEDTIWPHQWSVQNSTQIDGNNYIRNVKFDGKRLGKYFCTSELSLINLQYDMMGNLVADLALCGIGTTCHEFAHSLGLPDFYDTDYESNYICGGTYSYDTMCDGAYNNEGNTPPFFGAEELIMLGWMDSLTELPRMGQVTIPALSKTNKVAYKGASSTEGEYFVFECRGSSSWDAGISAGEGLIVYHVDKSSVKVSFPDDDNAEETPYNLWYYWESSNSINAAGKHPCYYIIPAGCQNYNYDKSHSGGYYGNPSETTGLNYSGSNFTFGKSSRYSEYSPVDWNKVTMDYKLTNISYSNGQVSFSVGADICYISVPASLSAGATLPLSLVGAPSGAKVSWFWDDTALSGSSVVLTSGKHLIEAKVTSGQTTIRIEAEVDVN